MSEAIYVARSLDVAARTFGGETMIMSGRDSALFSLNETASLLWQAADGVTPLARIVERDVCAIFDVDPATALADAQTLANELAAHGILRISLQPFADTGSAA